MFFAYYLYLYLNVDMANILKDSLPVFIAAMLYTRGPSPTSSSVAARLAMTLPVGAAEYTWMVSSLSGPPVRAEFQRGGNSFTGIT